jgi:hypothetical protein
MRQPKWTDQVKFKPWVQKAYWDSKVRTLIVGDSHYGKNPRDAGPEFTREILEAVISGSHSISFYTKAAGIIANKLVTVENRQTFWSSVAFYNYLQRLAGERPDDNVGYEEYEASNAAFKEVLIGLRPDIVIVLGSTVWGHMTDLDGEAKQIDDLPDVGVDPKYLEAWLYPSSTSDYALVFHVKHPARGFNFREFHPLYLQAVKRLSKLEATTGGR